METPQQVSKKEKQQEEPFDPETKETIEAFLKELYDKPQQQNQQSTNRRFIKFANDGEHKRLCFTGKPRKEQVPYKDFTTGEVVPGRFSDRYYFDCYDITDADHPSELSIWERGPKDATTILSWLSSNKQVLDATRHGQPGSTSTTYDIRPPMK
jgi:hypothetical protein